MFSLQKNRLLVFLDDSNLWIEGKRLAGIDGSEGDSRYRVGFKKLLKTINNDRSNKGAHDEVVGFLYGSWPPENDGMWKAAKKSGWKIFLFKKQPSDTRKLGTEKEVDDAITTDLISIGASARASRQQSLFKFTLITGTVTVYSLLLITQTLFL